jgi:hypothetical protein
MVLMTRCWARLRCWARGRHRGLGAAARSGETEALLVCRSCGLSAVVPLVLAGDHPLAPADTSGPWLIGDRETIAMLQAMASVDDALRDVDLTAGPS